MSREPGNDRFFLYQQGGECYPGAELDMAICAVVGEARAVCDAFWQAEPGAEYTLRRHALVASLRAQLRWMDQVISSHQRNLEQAFASADASPSSVPLATEADGSGPSA